MGKVDISVYETDSDTGEKKKKLVPAKGLINRRKREIELFRRK
jgi:hypothetical protein